MFPLDNSIRKWHAFLKTELSEVAMKRKPIVLAPLASALAALVPGAQAPPVPAEQALPVSQDATEPRTANLYYNIGNDLMSMVAFQRPDGTLGVQPDSHVSHASHSSHASHASHSSHASSI